MNNDIFRNAYLAQLGLIKEEDMQPVVPGAETEADEKPLKRVTFVTSDDVLIDALNSGFEEVVIFTNAKDEATGEDTVVEVKFGKDSFGELAIEDEVETEEEEIEECNEIKEEDEVEEIEDEELIEDDEETDIEDDEDFTEDEEIEDEEIEEAVSCKY